MSKESTLSNFSDVALQSKRLYQSVSKPHFNSELDLVAYSQNLQSAIIGIPFGPAFTSVKATVIVEHQLPENPITPNDIFTGPINISTVESVLFKAKAISRKRETKSKKKADDLIAMPLENSKRESKQWRLILSF